MQIDLSLDGSSRLNIKTGQQMERQRIYDLLDAAIREYGVATPCGLQVAINLIAVPERQAEYTAPVVA